MKTVLILAGSDPGAGAGLQQDLKTATLLGVYGLTVVTALTVQNSLGVHAVHPVTENLVEAQLDAVLQDFPVDAVKIGMVGTGAIVRILARRLRDMTERPPVVLDPVLAAGQGGALLDEEGIALLISDLFPLTTILTPNAPEAGRLTGRTIDSPAHLEEAARELQALGLKAGINAMLVGHYLTTLGQPPEQDQQLLASLGLEGGEAPIPGEYQS